MCRGHCLSYRHLPKPSLTSGTWYLDLECSRHFTDFFSLGTVFNLASSEHSHLDQTRRHRLHIASHVLEQTSDVGRTTRVFASQSAVWAARLLPLMEFAVYFCAAHLRCSANANPTGGKNPPSTVHRWASFVQRGWLAAIGEKCM